MNYQEAIRIAEEREKKLKTAFTRYDVEASGTIEAPEILPLLDELGMLKKLRTDRVEFLTKKLIELEINQEGTITFEEFKGYYNGCIDDALGKKPKPTSKRPGGRESAEEAARAKARAERARAAAAESERVRQECAELRSRVASAHKGKDPAEVEAAVGAARREAAIERAQRRKQAASETPPISGGDESANDGAADVAADEDAVLLASALPAETACEADVPGVEANDADAAAARQEAADATEEAPAAENGAGEAQTAVEVDNGGGDGGDGDGGDIAGGDGDGGDGGIEAASNEQPAQEAEAEEKAEDKEERS